MKHLKIILTIVAFLLVDYSLNSTTGAASAVTTTTTESGVISTESNTTSTSSTSESGSTHSTGTEGESTSPVIPGYHYGGFNETTIYPANFECLKVINPQNESQCFDLNMTDLGFSCCFVKTLVLGKSINNSCIAMDSNNLPAIQFIVKNSTTESESIYNCKSMIDRFTYDILLMILALILIN